MVRSMRLNKNLLLSDDFLIFATLVTSMAFRDIPVVSVYAKLIFPLILILKHTSGIFRIPRYKWSIYVYYVSFFMLCLFSIGWAVKTDYVLSECFVLARLYFTVFALSLVIHNRQDIEKSIYYIHYTGLVLFARLFMNTPMSVWTNSLYGSFDASSGQGRIGNTIGYHPNELGGVCVLLLLISCYIYSKKGKHKRWLIVWDIVLCFVLLFTKSRLSLLLALVGAALFFILSQHLAYKKIMFVILGVVSSIAAWYAIFNIPILYELVGFRFAGVVGSASSQDASTLTRMKFLMYAVDLYKSHPILGVGIDNYKYYAYVFQNAWQEVYAHSNWGELLADTGTIGIFLYYFPFLLSIYRLVKERKYLNADLIKLYALMVSFLIVTVIGDIQKMSYDRFDVFFPSLLAFYTAIYINTEIRALRAQ